MTDPAPTPVPVPAPEAAAAPAPRHAADGSVPAELDARFRDRAAAEGLLDAAWDIAESPIGPLLLAATARGLAWIGFDADDDGLDRAAAALGHRLLRVPRLLDPAQRELDGYFTGRVHAFELAVDLAGLPAFQRSVLEELQRVPYGSTATYAELALRVGNPRAARAVGGALNRNPVPIVVPCHRIVGSSGSLTGYAGGLERKRALLALEGATLV